MYSLKSKLIKTLDFIEDKNNVLFVDFLLHYSIGYLLIMSGIMKFFENELLVRGTKVCSWLGIMKEGWVWSIDG